MFLLTVAYSGVILLTVVLWEPFTYNSRIFACSWSYLLTIAIFCLQCPLASNKHLNGLQAKKLNWKQKGLQPDVKNLPPFSDRTILVGIVSQNSVLLVSMGYRATIARYVAKWGIAQMCLCETKCQRREGVVSAGLGKVRRRLWGTI